MGSYLFYDCGVLSNDFKELIQSEVSWNYGFGIVYNTKLGPIRIDAAFPYGKTSNPQLHASLLYMF